MTQVHPEASKPARTGPQTPWTSGTIDVDINADPGSDAKVSPFVCISLVFCTCSFGFCVCVPSCVGIPGTQDLTPASPAFPHTARLPFHARAKKASGAPRMFHTVTSAQGAAVHWQVRIHYYW